MMGTIEQCRQRVMGAVRGLDAAQIEAVAKRHHETGESVWHALHVALETPQCNCVACRRDAN